MSDSVQSRYPTSGDGWKAVTERGAAAIGLVAEQAATTLLATDFDGTLSPIVDDPTTARMHDDARDALSQLGPRVLRMAVVTGRAVEVVRQLGELDGAKGFENLLVLGQYGQESWDAGSQELVVPPAPPQVREALAELEQLLQDGVDGVDLAGASLEDKGRAVGVHTRRTADPKAAFDALREPVTRIAERHQLTLEPGRNVLELRSATTSKGDALTSLVEQVQPTVVVMMGDDLGDLPAFEAVHRLDQQGKLGICVVAGSGEQPQVAEQADVLCEGPAGVAAWLDQVVRAVDALSR